MKCVTVTVLPTVIENGEGQLMLVDPVPHRCKLILQKSQWMVLSIPSNEVSVITLKIDSKE